MMRKGMGLAGLLALVVVSPGWCGESSRGPLGRPVRFLSRSEAIGLALENMSPRCEVHWLGLDGTVGPSSKQLRQAVRLNQMLFNVETAYWNLYGSYWNLHSREQGLRQTLEAWCLVCSRYLVGKCGAADFAQAQGQYELFRAQRLTALDQLLDNERQLRELLGMKAENGTRLVPSDAPMLAEVEPSWDAALKEALKRRPELTIARGELALPLARLWLGAQLLSLGRATLPKEDEDCKKWEGITPGRLFLLGPETDEGDFLLRPVDPQADKRMESCLRHAKREVACLYLNLQDQQLHIERVLGLEYRRIIDTYQQIKAQRAQYETFAKQVRQRSQAFQAGSGTLDQLLEAQRFCADALSNECQAIVAYNNALSAFDFAQGRSQERHHLTVCTDSPEKDPAPARDRQVCPQSGDDWGQEVSEEHTTCDPSFTLPDLWEKTPPLKEVGPLPQVRELKQGQGLTEQDIGEVLPPPREADKESAPAK